MGTDWEALSPSIAVIIDKLRQNVGEERAHMETASAQTSPITTVKVPNYQRIGAACAIGGSMLNWIANLLHPKELLAYDSAAHLRTIAADWSWSLDHFLFILVGAITLWGLIAVSDSLRDTPGAYLARLSTSAAVVGTAILLIFFVLDGYGMQAAATLWLNAPAAEAVPALYAALLMSKLGLGTSSAYEAWYLGLLPVLYAIAMLKGGIYPQWISWLAILGGVLGIAAGTGFYLAGYSVAALVSFVVAQVILPTWVFAAGIVLYRSTGTVVTPPVQSTAAPVAR
jgi:hypothetical protein